MISEYAKRAAKVLPDYFDCNDWDQESIEREVQHAIDAALAEQASGLYCQICGRLLSDDKPDPELLQIAERLVSNSWDTYITQNQQERDWMSIADTILLDGRAMARDYIERHKGNSK